MSEGIVSRYGVYRDLNKSPYRYESPYGDIFKFRSQKKLEIYTRDVQKEIDKVERFVERRDLVHYLPREIVQMIYRATYQAIYDRVEG